MDKYIEKRCPKALEDEKKRVSDYMYITPRTLLGIVRLSQAMARLGFRDSVCKEDVDEALRLMDKCRSSIIDDSAKDGGSFPNTVEFRKMDATSAIFNQIKRLFGKAKAYKLKLNVIVDEIKGLGYTQENIEKCINEYASIDVLNHDKETSEISYTGK